MNSENIFAFSPALTLQLQHFMMTAVSDQIVINKEFGELNEASDWAPVHCANGSIQKCVRLLTIEMKDWKIAQAELVIDFEPESFIVDQASVHVDGEMAPSNSVALAANWRERSLRSTCQSLFMKDNSPHFQDTQALVRYYSGLHPEQSSPLQEDLLLCRAVYTGHRAMVDHLIDLAGNHPEKYHSKTHGGLLHHAVMPAAHEDVSLIQILIDRGCILESVNSDGCTALLSAARNGHARAVTCLLEAGANSLAKDLKGVGLISNQSSKQAVHAYRAWAAREAATQSLRLLDEKIP